MKMQWMSSLMQIIDVYGKVKVLAVKEAKEEAALVRDTEIIRAMKDIEAGQERKRSDSGEMVYNVIYPFSFANNTYSNATDPCCAYKECVAIVVLVFITVYLLINGQLPDNVNEHPLLDSVTERDRS